LASERELLADDPFKKDNSLLYLTYSRRGIFDMKEINYCVNETQC